MGITWIAGKLHELFSSSEEPPERSVHRKMKQVIVVNRALKLPKGKLSAQVAHAAVGAYVEASPQAQAAWLQLGMPKVVLEAADAGQLIHLLERAMQQELPCLLVQDAGRTVLPEGTITCLGIGPAPEDEVDAITGELKLLG